MRRNKTLVVGSAGFIGLHLMNELKADQLDLKLGQDLRYGIRGRYKTIIFLACDQYNSQEAYQNNLQMYEALDEHRKRFPKTYLIYISSAAVYNPISIYSQSKRLGEVYAQRFKKHAILRLSNVYGHGDGHGAPDRFMRGEKTIHGTGGQIRDLIPVELVVDDILDCLARQAQGIFNVSSGKGTTVNEMFALFGSGKPKYDKNHDFGVVHSVLKPGWVSWQ